MRDQYDALDARTKHFAIQIRWLGRQLVNAATSVAANQRAARRARSDKELAAKLSIIVEEADESAFWCELLADLPLPDALRPRLSDLVTEAHELRAIHAKGRATVRARLRVTLEKGKRVRG
jgi:four helix bundle protein